jgi:pSer/pThr/pTyr-binding forkhead associated (FHA) protein
MSGWVLRGANGDAPITFRLRPGSVRTIGRAPRADFIVDAALVSRLHCRLSATRDGVEVEDLRSTNGTFVNGARVTRARLGAGDVLGIGRLRLTLEREG